VRTEPEELFWILGEPGARDYEALPVSEIGTSHAFPNAGVYILRGDDLYLLFNASESGIKGRGSHGHNDALSIEVSAAGTAFIIDPGSFVYTHNLAERHLFRSTGYHSTVQVDGVEQNTIEAAIPFIIGNESKPQMIAWEITGERESVTAEHYGYRHLALPVTHRRTVQFYKAERFWLLEDQIAGAGMHELAFRFHCAPGLEVTAADILRLYDKISGARLFIAPLNEFPGPELQSGFVSTDYGAKQASVIACWMERAGVPQLKRWAIIPLRATEDDAAAVRLIAKLRAEAIPQNL
jgi:hypothetical protein